MSEPDNARAVTMCRRRRERLIEPLTSREPEILERVCDGWSNQEISNDAGVSVPTVKYHLMNVFGKLGVKRRTQAVAVAVYLHLVEPQWMFGEDFAAGRHARTRRQTVDSSYAAALP